MRASSDTLDRIARAVEKVRERLLRVARALDAAGAPYAVVGGNAVAAWVATVDEAAVRNTRDVNVLVRRCDFDRIRAALERAGFHYRHVAGVDAFLDSPGGSIRDAVHVVFAGEQVRDHEPRPNPDPREAPRLGELKVLPLEELVQIKLTAYRDKDRTHLRDMLDVGLIDATWRDRLPPVLATRLQALIDDPDG